MVSTSPPAGVELEADHDGDDPDTISAVESDSEWATAAAMDSNDVLADLPAALEILSSRRRRNAAGASASFLIEYGIKSGQLFLREGSNTMPILGLYVTAVHGRHNRLQVGGSQVDLEVGWAELRHVRGLSVTEGGTGLASTRSVASASDDVGMRIQTIHDSPSRSPDHTPSGFSVPAVGVLPPVPVAVGLPALGTRRASRKESSGSAESSPRAPHQLGGS